MKKQFLKLSLIFLVFLGLTSCTDDETIKYPTGGPAKAGVFVTVDFDATPLYNVSDLANSEVSGKFNAPTDNVASHTIQVRRISGGSVSSYTDVLTVTEFPAVFSITPNMIADALSMDVDDILAGDLFEFRGKSIGKDGTEATFNSLGSDLASEGGQKQAYKFQAYVSCPFNVDDAVGVYKVTNDPFFGAVGATFEVVAGPGDNQITMKDVFHDPSGPYDVAIDVDPASGIASFEQQNSWDTATYGMPYGVAWVDEDSNGFVFSCVGVISLNIKHSVALGTFGTYPFEAQKTN